MDDNFLITRKISNFQYLPCWTAGRITTPSFALPYQGHFILFTLPYQGHFILFALPYQSDFIVCPHIRANLFIARCFVRVFSQGIICPLIFIPGLSGSSTPRDFLGNLNLFYPPCEVAYTVIWRMTGMESELMLL